MRRGCVPLQRKNYCNAHSRQYNHRTPPGFRTAPARTLRPGGRSAAHGTQHDQSLRGKGRATGRQAVSASEPAAGRDLHLLSPEQGAPLLRTRRAAAGAGHRLARTHRLVEYRRHGLLSDSYYVSRRSDYAPLSQTTEHFPTAGTLPVLEAFARFAVRLHEKGVEHRDFNHGNILWTRTAGGTYRFQLIDINRMHFEERPLSSRACMINLRRLSCPAVAFLYILDRYAEARGWDVDDTLLRGTFFRLTFGHRKQLRKRFRRHKH